MKTKRKTNLLFYIPLLIIMTISIFVMYHARLISPLFKNNALKQCIFFGTGLFLLLIKEKINIKWLFEYSFYFYLINCILLLLVLFFGSTTNGAKAWFKLGFFNFQPSELMKLSLSLYLAQLTSKQKFTTKKDEIKYIGKILIICIIPSILVFLEPDTGAILFYLLITLTIAFTSKISKKWFLFIMVLAASFIGLFFYAYYYQQEILIKMIGTSFFYRVERLLNFQKGMQIENALIAIGAAPFFQWKLNETGIYIPEAPTDFAFALTSNVFGMAGNLTLLICYMLINYRLLKLWKEKKKERNYYFCSAFLSMFFTNQLYNILMNIGLVPIMGIPLPFLSYGGSTTIVYFLFLMLILKKEKTSKKVF